MQNEAIIRAYKSDDKAAVLKLLQLNTPAFFAPEEEKDLIFYLDHELEFYFVMEAEGLLIGCGGFNFSGDVTTGKISWDILHPNFQGKGFGSLLLNYRIDTLKEFKDLKKITVRTSQLAYKFYEKSGFTLLEKIKDYWAPGFDLYSMEYTK